MSVSIWAYLPERCDGDVCVGDCDLCSKAQDNVALMDMDSDAISRKAAIDIASGYCHPSNIAEEIAKLPCANLLKCVECMHWKEYKGIRKEKTHICEVFDWFSGENDFCSCAERKGGDGNG